jgi:hypothetical protein
VTHSAEQKIGSHEFRQHCSYEPQLPANACVRVIGMCFGRGLRQGSSIQSGQGAYILTQPQFWDTRDSLQPSRSTGVKWSFGGTRVGMEGREVVGAEPRSAHKHASRLGPEITRASRKIISICFGPAKLARRRLRPAGNGWPHQGPAHRRSHSPASSNSCRDNIHPLAHPE